MSKLIHKTREGSSTYGKPRVFMSFYKTDLAARFMNTTYDNDGNTVAALSEEEQ